MPRVALRHRVQLLAGADQVHVARVPLRVPIDSSRSGSHQSMLASLLKHTRRQWHTDQHTFGVFLHRIFFHSPAWHGAHGRAAATVASTG